MTKRLLKIALVVVVVVAIGVWAFSPGAVPADFVTVERGALQVTVNEEGRTRVRHRYVVSAPLPGRMTRIELDPGDPVVAGTTVVARFQPADPALLDARTRAELDARVRAAESALGGARADRERLRAELSLARSDLDRFRRLADEQVVARREVDVAEQQAEALTQAVQSAGFAVSTAEHQLALARAGLIQARAGGTSAIPLYAPIDGVVLRRVQESEAVVPIGTALIEVGNVGDLEIVSDLLSSAAVRVRPGQPVRIEQWGGDRPLEGRVRLVEPSGFTKISALGVEEQRVNTIIDFAGDAGERPVIGDGYRVEVRIIVASRENVLKVPVSSLFRQGTDWAVYLVEDDRAVARPVEVGQRTSLKAEITAGLNGGERIIVYPSDAVTPGVRVAARQ